MHTVHAKWSFCSGLTVVAICAVSCAEVPGHEAERSALAGQLVELTARHQPARPPGDDFIYFVMPDRFSNGSSANDLGAYVPTGGVPPDADSEVLKHGFLPTSKAYYHGGDLVGLIRRLDYIRNLGATAVWLSPVFKNKPVQGDGTIASSSSGYHGYWINDFLNPDPHLGSSQDFRELVERAHALGMKVYLDIITNHTSDVIRYEQCANCVYLSKADAAYRRADNGEPFDDSRYAFAYRDGTAFPPLAASSFPYTPFVPAEEAQAKNPAWLNDPIYYHNRGNTTFSGENSLYGDFFGLDDLFTEHPQVVSGMLDIYKYWIRTYGIDGFRVDTVKHVNLEFWQQFVPEIRAYARAHGKPDFFIYGEVFEHRQDLVSRFTKEGQFPATLDFPFQGTVAAVATGQAPTDALRQLFEGDDYFNDADSSAATLPTFLGNHDIGRIGAMIRRDDATDTADQQLARDELAHALMFTARGIPVVYYGDEQGFTGVERDSAGVASIGDQTARQDMFPSQVPSYQDPAINAQIGASTTPGDDNFRPGHPLYRFIRSLQKLRQAHLALRDGAQIHRYSSSRADGDIYAFSRILRDERREYVVAFNTSRDGYRSALVPTYHRQVAFERVVPDEGSTPPSILISDHDGRLAVTLPPMSFAIFKANQPLPDTKPAPTVTLTDPVTDFESGAFWVSAELGAEEFAEVSFFASESGGPPRLLGTDRNPPYRVFYDSTRLPVGATVTFAAVVTDYLGNTDVAIKSDVHIENRLPLLTVHYENGNNRASVFAITSQGRYLFSKPIDGAGFAAQFEPGESSITVFAEAPGATAFAFDRPIELQLKRDVLPFAGDAGGVFSATLYVNNRGEVSGSPNWVGTPLPAVLPSDPAAPNPASVQLYLRGAMNGWGTSEPLAYQGNYTFAGTTHLGGESEYKFADSSWSLYNFGAPFGTRGLSSGANSGNLLVRVPQVQEGTYQVHFFSYPAFDGSDGRYQFFRFGQ